MSLPTQPPKRKPRFALTLEGPADGRASLNGLRFILKKLLRQHGLKGITAFEIPLEEVDCEPDAIPGIPSPTKGGGQ